MILGIVGDSLQSDAHKALDRTIAEAEKEHKGGLLKLTRWRDGKVDTGAINIGDVREMNQRFMSFLLWSGRVIGEPQRLMERDIESVEHAKLVAARRKIMRNTDDLHSLPQ